MLTSLRPLLLAFVATLISPALTPAALPPPEPPHAVYLNRPNNWQLYIFENGAGSMCLGSGLETMATFPNGTFDFKTILAAASSRAGGPASASWSASDTIMFRQIGVPRPPWLVCKDKAWVDNLYRLALTKPYASKDLKRFKADLAAKPPV